MEFHTGARKIAKDSQRRGDLKTLGIDVRTVTSDQLRSEAKFDRLACALAKDMGCRVQPRSELFAQRRLDLHRTLMDPPRTASR